MVTKAKSASQWLAVLALGALMFEGLGGGVTAALALLVSQPKAGSVLAPSEAAAPARLHARVLQLEAASQELAVKLARARRDLSEL